MFFESWHHRFFAKYRNVPSTIQKAPFASYFELLRSQQTAFWCLKLYLVQNQQNCTFQKAFTVEILPLEIVGMTKFAQETDLCNAEENDQPFQQESMTNGTIPYYLGDIFYRIQHSKSFIPSIWRWWDGFRKTRPKSLIGDDNKHYWFTNYTRQTFPEVYQSCQAK